MTANEIKILSPQYMTKFKCLGAECDDTCCKFWRIDIDYETYKRYIKISDPKLKYLVGKYVVKKRDNENKNRYAFFKLREDGYCAFLDNDGLCTFQKKCGSSFLSNVCMTYPRKQVQIEDTLERSGTVSCPEIARIMLFDEHPMEFDEFLEKAEDRIITERVVTSSDENLVMRPLLKWLWPLREIYIEILQNREYSIKDRLVLIGLFSNKLENLRNEEKYDGIPEHIERYYNVMKSGYVQSMLENIPSDGYLQFKLIMEMLVSRLKFASISQTFAGVLEEFKQGIGYFEGVTIRQLFSNYNEIKTEYGNKFDEQFPHVFENYFVNYVFSNVFPLYPALNAFENYIRLVVDYAIIRMFLTGVGAYHKGYNKEIVRKVFSGISLTVEHNPEYVDLIVKAISNLKGGVMAYTTVLVRG